MIPCIIPDTSEGVVCSACPEHISQDSHFGFLFVTCNVYVTSAYIHNYIFWRLILLFVIVKCLLTRFRETSASWLSCLEWDLIMCWNTIFLVELQGKVLLWLSYFGLIVISCGWPMISELLVINLIFRPKTQQDGLYRD